MRKRYSESTLKKLFALSRNRCAFPGCPQEIVDSENNIIGEICHIEAAESGGERFNLKQTDEERCSYENLILLCRNHHKVTNNITIYTVVKLKEMKKNHEAKFKDIVEKINSDIKDHTNENKICIPKTLMGISEFFKWGLGDDEVNGNIAWIENFASRLKKLPREARQLLYIIFDRAEEKYYSRIFVTFETPVVEIKKICKLSINEINENMIILEKYKFCEFDTNFEDIRIINISDDKFDGLWKYLKDYCSAKSINISDMIVNLRFDLLD